jgi:uncharacterized protein YnzC (UPF0291/DUF896 family)
MNEWMSPSQIFDRIQELRQKMEYENLSSEEKEELKELKDLLKESEPDFSEL